MSSAERTAVIRSGPTVLKIVIVPISARMPFACTSGTELALNCFRAHHASHQRSLQHEAIVHIVEMRRRVQHINKP
jgi:hypothetical protein